MLILGNLRHKIEILIAATQKNDFGEVQEVYINFLTLKAEKKEISGNKTVDNQEIFSAKRVDFITHYRPSITDDMRVKFNGKQYRILFIQEIGYKEGLTLQTELIND